MIGVNIRMHAVELHARYCVNSAVALGVVATVCRTIICEIIIRKIIMCNIIIYNIVTCKIIVREIKYM